MHQMVDDSLAEQLLSEVDNDSVLHPYIIDAQFYVRMTDSRFARILRAAVTPSPGTSSFYLLDGHQSTIASTPEHLQQLIVALAAHEEQMDAAVRILHTRLKYFEVENLPISPVDIITGKKLLCLLHYRDRSPTPTDVDYIARTCIAEDDFEVAQIILSRLKQARVDTFVSYRDYEGILEVVASYFPRLFLDSLVDGDDAGIRRSRLLLNREFSSNPVNLIWIEHLTAWANEDTKERSAILADSILAWKDVNGENSHYGLMQKNLVWTPEALKLLQVAPEPSIVLDRFLLRLYVNSQAGVKAPIFESRLSLFDQLEALQLSGVKEWVERGRRSFDRVLADARCRDAEEYGREHEKFDY